MKSLCKLFFIFAKIGLFTLGGGYAMLPLMEQELVGTYLSKEDFLDVTAVAQSAPGIMAINVAILTGYRLHKVPGAVFAACGAALPSFVIILLIALFFQKFAENPVVHRVFMGVRPAVVALIMVPVFNLAKSAGVTLKTVWVCVAVAVAVWLFQISPVYVVLIAICCGLLLGRKERAK
ncbi:MAG: chromate transporter [Elusimicrobiaceae bacterium]|nr:chromate transporter [Elusimicrobiaceae bacterium]